ncbi:hypothetical protein SAMN04489751_2668 [Brevibacterium sandarakinum]|uniref:Uncharacterized protein n=1 Tax=Brevibacterium sandarakinum TaxID=629680 RepID=A0A1H1UGJ6_BRESA|nr:hypothetical protein [Brevibacterium sandarakinum]SDS71500.1 hypothetical protein SAMN04489751_2668 [Brevibacterium sandarakinum]
MDTSIIVVIAIIVVFAVVVPTMIRKSATELSRVEIDTVPEQAEVVAADPQIPGHDHTERARVFHSSATIEPTVPRPDVAPLTEAPKLSLSARAPEFAVIDGRTDSSSTTNTSSTTAEADEQHQRSSLPVAVGETRSAYLDSLSHSAHEASATSDNVRLLHPAVHAVFNQSPQGANGRSSADGGDAAGGSARPGHAQPRSLHTRSTESITTGTTETTRRGTQIPNPSFGADEDHSMTEKATTLRESMKSLRTMTRGFALLFLAFVLGILVTGVLAMFSIVHVALTGVFCGVAIVSLLIVRTLNLRKREVKARLREIEGRTAKTRNGATKTRAAQRTSAAPKAPAASSRTAAPTAGASKTGAPTTAAPKAAEAKPTAARPAGSTKAAQARAVMQRNASAKHNREEADTGEIPLVRIRNEAAEGHTTRQVLLTGPIPIVEEAADADATETAEASTAEKTSTEKTPAEKAAATKAASEVSADESTPTAKSSIAAGSVSEAEAAPQADPTAETDSAEDPDSDRDAGAETTASKADTGNVSDPFMQRLQARDAWSPTPLPVPSYVDAPHVEHPVPEAKAADASSYESYETEARSREDIAAQFAAELGYRAELSDSARDDSPLEHGRKAIRTNKGPELGAVDDVLARRRA